MARQQPHPLVVRLARIHAGVRIPRARGRSSNSLLPAILEQKVTSGEAHRAYRGLIRVHGEPAPRTARVAPPAANRRHPSWRLCPITAFHPFGIEQRRAELIPAGRGERTGLVRGGSPTSPAGEAYARLTAVPGIGPWTAAEIGGPRAG